MNLDKYEKIDGREALRRLADGEKIYDIDGTNWVIEDSGHVMFQGRNKRDLRIASITIDNLVGMELYIPKPFDVRQAMLERPNEWVGAFLRNDGEWMLIGFDTHAFEATSTPFANSKLNVKPQDDYACQMLSTIYIDKCIPIEDVPEEETR